MRVYLSGPITGHGTAAADFDRAWREARDSDPSAEIINPLDIDPGHPEKCLPGYGPGTGGHTSSCHMRADLAELLRCDRIHMLPGWSKSRGATVEQAVAVAIGLEITGAAS